MSKGCNDKEQQENGSRLKFVFGFPAEAPLVPSCECVVLMLKQ
jgi:hypothetical protein